MKQNEDSAWVDFATHPPTVLLYVGRLDWYLERW